MGIFFFSKMLILVFEANSDDAYLEQKLHFFGDFDSLCTSLCPYKHTFFKCALECHYKPAKSLQSHLKCKTISLLQGTESGVEILINEPYTDGPGGNGQFTHKIYHVGSHLPGWFKSLLPKSALTVEEEAWNAYPYTKTRFKCPFVEK